MGKDMDAVKNEINAHNRRFKASTVANEWISILAVIILPFTGIQIYAVATPACRPCRRLRIPRVCLSPLQRVSFR